MKKFIIFVLWAVSATVTMAQVNPKSGIVITNTGDTLRGNIDLRTNEKLSKQCTFQANGKSETKIYKPGDIEGFRFDEGGKFFVTRRLNVTGEPQLYFAEFMVQGKMNLYCITHNSEDHFFFEREDGEMAELTDGHLVGDAQQLFNLFVFHIIFLCFPDNIVTFSEISFLFHTCISLSHTLTIAQVSRLQYSRSDLRAASAFALGIAWIRGKMDIASPPLWTSPGRLW